MTVITVVRSSLAVLGIVGQTAATGNRYVTNGSDARMNALGGLLRPALPFERRPVAIKGWRVAGLELSMGTGRLTGGAPPRGPRRVLDRGPRLPQPKDPANAQTGGKVDASIGGGGGGGQGIGFFQGVSPTAATAAATVTLRGLEKTVAAEVLLLMMMIVAIAVKRLQRIEGSVLRPSVAVERFRP